MMSILAALGLMLGGSALASGMPVLAKKNGCDNCHDIDKRVVGPSWMEVSKRYKKAAKYTYGGKEYALEDGLVMRVSKGGSGKWAAMPMPANDPNGTNQAEMRELVKFVLGLAK
jgi:cytochrome c551/c552